MRWTTCRSDGFLSPKYSRRRHSMQAAGAVCGIKKPKLKSACPTASVAVITRSSAGKKIIPTSAEKKRRPREEDEVAAGLIGPGRRWGRSDIGASAGLLNSRGDPGRRVRSPLVRLAPGGGGAFRTTSEADASLSNCGYTKEEDWCCRLCYRPREEAGARINLICRKRLRLRSA